MTPEERIAQLEAELVDARQTRDAMRLVAQLALGELKDTRDVLEVALLECAQCTCQRTQSPANAQALD